MNITDLIADTIQQLLEEHGGTIQIQRNSLANSLGCVPSQINYVITSRFTKEQGYIVESRRGGGGFIRIVKLEHSKNEIIFHIINSLGNELDEYSARVIIESLLFDEHINNLQAKLMMACMYDDNFRGLLDIDKKIIRANLFKSMLLNTI